MGSFETSSADVALMGDAPERMALAGTDLEIQAHLQQEDLVIDVMKAGKLVHRLAIEQAKSPLESAWLIDLFSRSERVRLTDVSAEVDDYINSLNIAQG